MLKFKWVPDSFQAATLAEKLTLGMNTASFWQAHRQRLHNPKIYIYGFTFKVWNRIYWQCYFIQILDLIYFLCVTIAFEKKIKKTLLYRRINVKVCSSKIHIDVSSVVYRRKIAVATVNKVSVRGSCRYNKRPVISVNL